MNKVVLLALLGLLPVPGAITATPTSTCNGNAPFGCFPARPQLEWLDDGRTMQLLREFTYIDPNTTIWTSTAGSKVDGASIPRVLWSFVGGPFEGQYRNASIVHDTECDLKEHPWRSVHRMFYDATRAGGVGFIKGRLMYVAVYQFGPRWNQPKPLWRIAIDHAEDYLVRILVILRRDRGLGKISLDDLEKKTYDDVRKEVSDDDPDLHRVRDLLKQRKELDTPGLTRQNFQELLRKLDEALYFENDVPPQSSERMVRPESRV